MGHIESILDFLSRFRVLLRRNALTEGLSCLALCLLVAGTSAILLAQHDEHVSWVRLYALCAFGGSAGVVFWRYGFSVWRRTANALDVAIQLELRATGGS